MRSARVRSLRSVFSRAFIRSQRSSACCCRAGSSCSRCSWSTSSTCFLGRGPAHAAAGCQQGGQGQPYRTRQSSLSIVGSGLGCPELPPAEDELSTEEHHEHEEQDLGDARGTRGQVRRIRKGSDRPRSPRKMMVHRSMGKVVLVPQATTWSGAPRNQPKLHHAVHDAVVHALLSIHPEVAVEVGGSIHFLAAVLGGISAPGGGLESPQPGWRCRWPVRRRHRGWWIATRPCSRQKRQPWHPRSRAGWSPCWRRGRRTQCSRALQAVHGVIDGLPAVTYLLGLFITSCTSFLGRPGPYIRRSIPCGTAVVHLSPEEHAAFLRQLASTGPEGDCSPWEGRVFEVGRRCPSEVVGMKWGCKTPISMHHPLGNGHPCIGFLVKEPAGGTGLLDQKWTSPPCPHLPMMRTR